MILLFSEEKFTVPILMNNMNSGMLQDLGAKYTAIAISIIPIIILYCFFSKPSCPTFGTTINETVQAIGY